MWFAFTPQMAVNLARHTTKSILSTATRTRASHLTSSKTFMTTPTAMDKFALADKYKGLEKNVW